MGKSEAIKQLLSEYEKSWELKKLILEAEEKNMKVGDYLLLNANIKEINGFYEFNN